jgi:FtsZ-binding cell division protein ZapB
MATSCIERTGDAPIFDGTNFAHWKIHMSCYFRAMSPKIWWIIDVDFSHALDDQSPTKEQEKYLHINAQGTNALFSALSMDVFYKVHKLKSAHDMWMKLQEISQESNMENVDCIDDLVILDDCSTSSSSNGDSYSISSSHDQIDNSFSYAHVDEFTSPSSSPHCLMAKGNTKVKFDDSDDDNDDHEYTYDELVEMLKGMHKYVDKSEYEITTLKKENSSLKDLCEELKRSHEELEKSHENLKLSHENLSETH